ncbi:arrestin domain-containing protein 2-like isoform 2-T2 [Menidia menidia]
MEKCPWSTATRGTTSTLSTLFYRIKTKEMVQKSLVLEEMCIHSALTFLIMTCLHLIKGNGTKSEFPFASRSEMILIGLKEQQYATRISFGSGKVTINVTSEKLGLEQGEAMQVFLEVLNESARPVTPKFFLCEKQTFVAPTGRTVHTNDILFGMGDPVPPASRQVLTKVLSIPPGLPPTFYNCCMMKLEYQIKITLDAPLMKDPEVKLPLVILHGSHKPHQRKKERSTRFKKLTG